MPQVTWRRYASNVFVRSGDFRWVRGDDLVVSYRLPGTPRFGNAFCRVCGSPMPRAVPGRDFVVVPAGSLDVEPGIRPGYHIFVGSKAAWHEITDRLPQYEEYPPEG